MHVNRESFNGNPRDIEFKCGVVNFPRDELLFPDRVIVRLQVMEAGQ